MLYRFSLSFLIFFHLIGSIWCIGFFCGGLFNQFSTLLKKNTMWIKCLWSGDSLRKIRHFTSLLQENSTLFFMSQISFYLLAIGLKPLARIVFVKTVEAFETFNFTTFVIVGMKLFCVTLKNQKR